MKKIIRGLSLLTVIALLFILAACGNGGSKADDKIVIGYSTIAHNIAVLPQFMYSNLEKGCAERGWDLLLLAAEGDPMLQGEQVKQLIQQEPDFIVLFPADPMLAIDWVNDIAEAGIPCIALHVDVDESVRQHVSAYVGINNYQMASDIAMEIIRHYGANAEINIVQIGGVPVQTDYIQRVAGFTDTINANSNFNILGIEWAFSSRADAQGFMENYISTYGDSINVLMGYDDDLTLGGVNALQAAGMTDVRVYSITGQNEAIAAIKDGKMTLSAYFSCADAIAEVFRCLDDLVAGKPIDNYFRFIKTPFITIDNAHQFQNEF